ncbi:MAG: UDP-glucose 4-epimerase GalE [Pirellula sp.]|jgi:UDP-glucose 4-epimerase|nr:UDP-glucose 4-epimerase GalE [Pirellula sp.]
MKVLVVGGAGYVGSHTVRLLLAQGHEVWVYDNLSLGHRESVPAGRLIEGNLTDRALLMQVMRDKEIEAVMHFAAYALVGESVQHPAMYYQNNVIATFELLEAMRAVGVWRFVFSSTTATYGQPETMPISEDTPQNPINPYGFTKLVVERALADYAHAYGFGVAALRYFNASGAASDASIGEDHDPESHLIPIVLQVALGQRPHISIFGTDYPTEDGTCIRDYIHVEDLATAHLAALQKLQPNSVLQMNLGTGVGHSVQQVIEACRKITGHPIPAVIGPRRAGDPACLIADSSKAQRELNWRPKYVSIESIVETAWKWHQSHPRGYSS